jgi:homoserine O-acetyltransferase
MPAYGADAANRTRWPNYLESDFVIKDYVFRSGERLPELKLYYRTLGTPKRNAAGKIVNGVLLLQGNTGTGANWLRPSLADELFGPGQPLDATEYLHDHAGRDRTWRIEQAVRRAQREISPLPLP